MDYALPRPRRLSCETHDFIVANPHPGDDLLSRLRHVNQVSADLPADDMAVTTTHSIYAAAERTGLTNGDLRELAVLVEKLTTDRQALTELAETAIGWQGWEPECSELAAWGEKFAQHRAPVEGGQS